jgi:hypothetical protein
MMRGQTYLVPLMVAMVNGHGLSLFNRGPGMELIGEKAFLIT